MKEQTPLVVVIAGPNGAGKSTLSRRILQDAMTVTEFVNADTIAQGMSAFQPESVALAAGRVMLARLRSLAEARVSFAFETTLSGRNFAPWLGELRSAGYRAHLVFVSLPEPELALSRVRDRVRSGGHHVPEDVVRRRYASGLTNFFGLYQNVVDSWQLLDNSVTGQPSLVARRDAGMEPEIFDASAWRNLMERQREQR